MNAPTVATSSARLLAAYANEYDLELCHFDVDQAFVRADLKEDVFMRLPEGCGEFSGKVVKLNKNLYCLSQASRQWYAMLKECLAALGLEHSRFVCFSFDSRGDSSFDSSSECR